ncbi:sulfite exporter TauE/SafE family protein [Amphibacillus sediminis]|uniref:sulfite exporter TauE/SafE family protein n=1 Tax=Amphibacillus sediminis TaxID=360185 RepID=UPI00082A2DBC|nr:sulfite exporter TauE/SafE family protein [Amphibacillus sediminis]
MFVIYLLIGFLATFAGAMAGLSGGVILKPVLDFFGHYDLASIGVLSGACVLAMSSVSLISSNKQGQQVKRVQSFLIAIGSVIGGTLGKSIFNRIFTSVQLSQHVGWIQSSLLIVILVIIFIFIKYRQNFKTYQIKHPLVILMVGLTLGLAAAFLGIGGGPLNVAILSWLFSMDAKAAALNSIFIIFFAQLSGMLVVFFTTDVSDYHLTMLPVMIVGGITGGLLGSRLRIWLTVRHVELIFNTLIVGIIFLNAYNLLVYAGLAN